MVSVLVGLGSVGLGEEVAEQPVETGAVFEHSVA
jgi:hypothetical protein